MSMPTSGSDVPYLYSTNYFKAVRDGDSIPELILAMADYSGYIREAAVTRAVELAHPAFLPALAVRLNDWVPKVRDVARAAVITLLPLMPHTALLDILPAIAGLRNAGRHDHADWIATFERHLLQHIGHGTLADGLRSPDMKVARACFDLLLRHATPNALDVIRSGVLSSDIVTGSRATGAIATLDPAERESAYRAALQSRFGPVRAGALHGFLHYTASPLKLDTAIAQLVDTQARVRAVAIDWLAAAQVDASRTYRQILAAPTSPARLLCTSLAALCTFRQPDDALLVSTFATHPVTAVRTAAYVAWLKLAPHDKDQIALAALGDQAERVRKVAMEMVDRRGAFVPFAAACALLNRPADWPRLMRLGGNGEWDAIEAIARMAPCSDATMRATLLAELETWLATADGHHRPTVVQAAFLRSDEARASLAALAGRDLREVVEHALALASTRRR